MSADYGGTVDQVHDAFADERYWQARLADSGADDATLDALEVGPDGSVAVATTQTLHRDRLPGLVTQFHRGDLCITRRENWGPVRGQKANAQVSGNIQGAPVTLGGNAVLIGKSGAAGGSAHLTFHGSVEVRVPLVGGKIESFISTQLVELLTAEQRFTTQWLAANG